MDESSKQRCFTYLHEAQAGLESVLDDLEVALRAAEVAGEGMVVGQLKNYTIPTIRAFIDDLNQPGSLRGLKRILHPTCDGCGAVFDDKGDCNC